MNTFMLEILQIDREEYKKLLKGQLNYINSEKFMKLKNKLLDSKHKKYFSNRNLNKRNYYNKEKLTKQAKIQNVNIYDFAIKILCKNRESFRKVINDENGRIRLYIGKYVNSKLPTIYIERNIEEIYESAKRIVDRAALIRGIHVSIEDKEDLIQDCVNYIIENGNMLDKRGSPIIISEYATKHNKNKIFLKTYYYAIRNIENYRKNKHSRYIENAKYTEEYIF